MNLSSQQLVGKLFFQVQSVEEPTGGYCIFLVEAVCRSPGAHSSRVSRGLTLAFMVLPVLPLSPLLSSPRRGWLVKPVAEI